MRIVFVRHGHPNYADDCLTPLGHRHAEAASQRLLEENIERVFSSTCGRAMETAAYLAKKLNLPIEEQDFMREINWGSVNDIPLYQNGHPWDTADRMVAENDSLLHPDWMSRKPFLGNKVVDCVSHIATEVDRWLQTLGYTREGLYYRAQNPCHKTVAAFGHGGATAAILCHMLNLPFPFTCAAMGLDYTGITIVNLPEEKGALGAARFITVNDARHIRDMKIQNIYDR